MAEVGCGDGSPFRGRSISRRTPEIEEAFLAALRAGASLETACRAVRISRTAIMNWRKADSEFNDKVIGARSEMEVSLLEIIEKAAAKSWQAAAWKLERLFPQRYALKREDVQGAVKVVVEGGLPRGQGSVTVEGGIRRSGGGVEGDNADDNAADTALGSGGSVELPE